MKIFGVFFLVLAVGINAFPTEKAKVKKSRGPASRTVLKCKLETPLGSKEATLTIQNTSPGIRGQMTKVKFPEMANGESFGSIELSAFANRVDSGIIAKFEGMLNESGGPILGGSCDIGKAAYSTDSCSTIQGNEKVTLSCASAE